MPEDVFRWVVAVGVLLACVAFVSQAVVFMAMYRIAKDALEAGKRTQSKFDPIMDRVHAILNTTGRILDENRPRIAEIGTEASIIIKTTREHAERIGELIDDTSERARTRIAQIDHAVEETVGQVEQVSETVKAAVMRPAKEVNGILNGFKTAVNAYAEGRRRPSVDRATQDEEMFI